jgi:hypothetical protein
MPCTAIKQDGTQCTKLARYFEGLCGTHFNVYMKNPDFAARYNAYIAAREEEDRREQAARAERERRAAEERAARLAAEEARRVAEAAIRRQEKIAKRDRHLAYVANIGPVKIMDHGRKAIEIWEQNRIEGYTIPKAYTALCYLPSNHEGFISLMTAIVRLRFQSSGNHPDYAHYRDVPADERTQVLMEIQNALIPYGEIDPERMLIGSDHVLTKIANRRVLEREEELRRQRAAEQARQQAEEAARRAALQAQLRVEPVVFRRDPEGGIDLRAFATDGQSVHRSSVQNATHKAVIALLARPKLQDVDSLEEIVAVFNDPSRIHWHGSRGGIELRDLAITEITNDYFNTEAFSVRYGDVVDSVWAFIRGHEHNTQLCIRLAQEISEGRGMCTNGKMARLVNVLMGFDETLETEAPREVFQFRIAALRKQPIEERAAAARALFVEFRIPEEEHTAWLDPLMEPEDVHDPVAAVAAVAAI